jgi:hypothetical protein
MTVLLLSATIPDNAANLAFIDNLKRVIHYLEAGTDNLTSLGLQDGENLEFEIYQNCNVEIPDFEGMYRGAGLGKEED